MFSFGHVTFSQSFKEPAFAPSIKETLLRRERMAVALVKSFRIAPGFGGSTLTSPVIPFHNPPKGIPVPLEGLSASLCTYALSEKEHYVLDKPHTSFRPDIQANTVSNQILKRPSDFAKDLPLNFQIPVWTE
ncbi:hypothetical protein FQN60_007824, partial [Etheostoma spectabile]